MRHAFAKTFVLMLTAGTLFGGVAHETSYRGTGTVALVRSHDAAVSEDWVQITAVASQGTCPIYNGPVATRSTLTPPSIRTSHENGTCSDEPPCWHTAAILHR